MDLGGLTLQALGIPGHTPEHLSYLLRDGSTPVALFSGGSLLVGAVARTDLIAPGRTEELARALWRSLRERILTLPDHLPVYPTHGSGSFCSAPAGAERTTTVGGATNPLLNVADEDAIVTTLLGGLGSFPSYFLRLGEVNRRGPAVYGRNPPLLAPLEVAEVVRLVGDGALIVDVRDVTVFAAGHIPGSLSVPLRDAFATWLGWLVDADRPLVFVLEREQDIAEVVRRALNIGYEQLAGALAGGIGAWTSAGRDVERIGLVRAAAITGPVLDIRQQAEFAAGHLPGAANIELGSLAQTLPQRGPLTLICGHGERAMTGASILAAAGHAHLTVAVGGPADWAAADGRRVETGT